MSRTGTEFTAATPHDLAHQAWAWTASILAIAVFLVDTFSPLQTAIAVFYIIVIHLAASTSRRDYVIITAAACTLLTIASYVIVHGAETPGPSLIRGIVSLSAIGITSTLALRNCAIEQTLREQANLLELTHDAVFVRDMNNVITYWNRGAEELYGWNRADAIGHNSDLLLQTRFPGGDGQAIHDAVQRNGRWEGRLIHTTRTGAEVVAASRWALQRDKQGQPKAVLETNTDITARTRAQEALDRTQAALAHAGRVATLGELSASIAHEVNQPLAAIVTNGEAALRWLARAEPDIKEAEDALTRVIADGRRAGAVIRRIQRLARKDEQNKVPLDLNDIIRESLALIEREMSTRAIRLELDLQDPLPMVQADRIELQQVLVNLLINAIQAMEPVSPERRHLLVRSVSDGNRIHLQVRDSGIGFDDEMAKHLFITFFTTKESGMGLGLPICRSIVESHGGQIFATRNEGPAGVASGASFHVSLPVSGAA